MGSGDVSCLGSGKNWSTKPDCNRLRREFDYLLRILATSIMLFSGFFGWHDKLFGPGNKSRWRNHSHLNIWLLQPTLNRLPSPTTTWTLRYTNTHIALHTYPQSWTNIFNVRLLTLLASSVPSRLSATSNLPHQLASQSSVSNTINAIAKNRITTHSPKSCMDMEVIPIQSLGRPLKTLTPLQGTSHHIPQKLEING